MTIQKVISLNLKAWMRDNKALSTIDAVAQEAKIGFGTVQRIRDGEGNPTIGNLDKVARAFKRTVIDLLSGYAPDPDHDSEPVLSEAGRHVVRKLATMSAREIYQAAAVIDALTGESPPTSTEGRRTTLNAPPEPNLPEDTKPERPSRRVNTS